MTKKTPKEIVSASMQFNLKGGSIVKLKDVHFDPENQTVNGYHKGHLVTIEWKPADA